MNEMEKPWCKYGDHGITTLRDFFTEHKRINKEFRSLLEPLEA
ncbi:hypothetical protein [Anaeromassilibacillus sp. SJQ-5]